MPDLAAAAGIVAVAGTAAAGMTAAVVAGIAALAVVGIAALVVAGIVAAAVADTAEAVAVTREQRLHFVRIPGRNLSRLVPEKRILNKIPSLKPPYILINPFSIVWSVAHVHPNNKNLSLVYHVLYYCQVSYDSWCYVSWTSASPSSIDSSSANSRRISFALSFRSPSTRSETSHFSALFSVIMYKNSH